MIATHELAAGRSPVAEQAETHWHLDPATTRMIEERAYQLYLDRERAGSPGDAVADWLAAEAYVFDHAPHVDPDPRAPDWS